MTQSTSQPYGIRTIVDFAKRTIDPYFVIGPRAVNPFWIHASRLPQLLTLADGTVAVMDAVNKDTDDTKTKEVYRDKDVFVFFTNEEVSGTITLAKLVEYITAYEEAPRAATLAESDRAADVRKRVEALHGKSGASSSASVSASPVTPPARS